jgi:hypothetical protein
MPQAPAQPDAEQSPDVRVGCRLNNGLVLESYEEVMDASTGLPKYEVSGRAVLPGTHAVRDSSVVPISESGEFTVTTVPRALWESWLAANVGNSLVTGGMIYAIEDERSPDPDKGSI